MKKILILALLILSTFHPSAFAGDYDIKEMTASVEAALEARRARFSQLEELKNQGIVGESRDGLVENLTGSSEADPVVNAENRDRNAVYSAIVQQNNLPETELFTVKRVFAETQRSKAKSGQPIQLEGGQWTKK